jgi:hypothetical protein
MDADARKSSGQALFDDDFSFRFAPLTTALLADRIDERLNPTSSQQSWFKSVRDCGQDQRNRNDYP